MGAGTKIKYSLAERNDQSGALLARDAMPGAGKLRKRHHFYIKAAAVNT
jgi:hypothetical protein